MSYQEAVDEAFRLEKVQRNLKGEYQMLQPSTRSSTTNAISSQRVPTHNSYMDINNIGTQGSKPMEDKVVSTMEQLVKQVQALATSMKKMEEHRTNNYRARERQFRSTRGERTTDGQPICYRCRRAGHMSYNCPDQPTNTSTSSFVPLTQDTGVRSTTSNMHPHVSRQAQIAQGIQERGAAAVQQCERVEVKEREEKKVSMIHAIGKWAFEVDGTVCGLAVSGIVLDTGSAITVINKEMCNRLVQLGMKASPIPEEVLKECKCYNATGGTMEPTTIINNILIDIQGYKAGIVNAVVIDELKSEILIGWDQLKNIGKYVDLVDESIVLHNDVPVKGRANPKLKKNVYHVYEMSSGLPSHIPIICMQEYPTAQVAQKEALENESSISKQGWGVKQEIMNTDGYLPCNVAATGSVLGMYGMHSDVHNIVDISTVTDGNATSTQSTTDIVTQVSAAY